MMKTELTIDDVEQLYLTKCSKYEEKQLTKKLQDILFKEALNEVIQINAINRGLKK